MPPDDDGAGSAARAPTPRAPAPATPATIARAVDVLAAGGVVAFPTETVYGLGADAMDERAVARVFRIKGRPADHPLIVHLGRSAVDDPSVLTRWAGAVTDEVRRLASAFWPGPLTIIVARAPGVPDAVTGGRDTVGLRVPDHPVALDLLDAFAAVGSGGVAAPSANRFGRVSPTTAGHVVADLGDVVDLVLDGGPCAVGVESTIVDATCHPVEILRPGAVDAQQIAAVLGSAPGVWRGEGAARAPGMLAAHYAPAARIVLSAVADVAALVSDPTLAGPVGVVAPRVVDDLPAEVMELEPLGDGASYARGVYDRLRQADRLGLATLLVVPPAPDGIGLAVIDRLERAARGSASREDAGADPGATTDDTTAQGTDSGAGPGRGDAVEGT